MVTTVGGPVSIRQGNHGNERSSSPLVDLLLTWRIPSIPTSACFDGSILAERCPPHRAAEAAASAARRPASGSRRTSAIAV